MHDAFILYPLHWHCQKLPWIVCANSHAIRHNHDFEAIRGWKRATFKSLASLRRCCGPPPLGPHCNPWKDEGQFMRRFRARSSVGFHVTTRLCTDKRIHDENVNNLLPSVKSKCKFQTNKVNASCIRVCGFTWKKKLRDVSHLSAQWRFLSLTSVSQFTVSETSLNRHKLERFHSESTLRQQDKIKASKVWQNTEKRKGKKCGWEIWHKGQTVCGCVMCVGVGLGGLLRHQSFAWDVFCKLMSTTMNTRSQKVFRSVLVVGNKDPLWPCVSFYFQRERGIVWKLVAQYNTTSRSSIQHIFYDILLYTCK